MNLFFLSRLTSTLGDQFLLFVVPILVYRATGSVAWSGLAFAIEQIPRVAYFPLAGLLADRHAPQRLIKYSLRLRSATCLLAILVVALGGEAYILPTVITLAALSGVFTCQYFMSSEVLLPRVFDTQPFARVQSWTQTVDQVSIVAGPLLAALLIQSESWHLVIILASILFIGSQVIFSLWQRLASSPETTITTRLEKLQFMNMVVKAIRLLLSNPYLLRVVALTALVNLVFGATMATAAAFVTGVFQQQPSAYGMLQMSGAITSIAMLSLTAYLATRVSVTSIGIISYVFICIGGFVYSQSINYWLFCLGFMLVLGFDGMFNVYIRTIRQKLIPAQDYGKTTGVIIFFNNSTKPLAGLIVAGLSPIIGVQNTIMLVTVLITILGLLLMLGAKRSYS